MIPNGNLLYTCPVVTREASSGSRRENVQSSCPEIMWRNSLNWTSLADSSLGDHGTLGKMGRKDCRSQNHGRHKNMAHKIN